MSKVTRTILRDGSKVHERLTDDIIAYKHKIDALLVATEHDAFSQYALSDFARKVLDSNFIISPMPESHILKQRGLIDDKGELNDLMLHVAKSTFKFKDSKSFEPTNPILYQVNSYEPDTSDVDIIQGDPEESVLLAGVMSDLNNHR